MPLDLLPIGEHPVGSRPFNLLRYQSIHGLSRDEYLMGANYSSMTKGSKIHSTSLVPIDMTLGIES